jgi:hypothetical protein
MSGHSSVDIFHVASSYSLWDFFIEFSVVLIHYVQFWATISILVGIVTKIYTNVFYLVKGFIFHLVLYYFYFHQSKNTRMHQ